MVENIFILFTGPFRFSFSAVKCWKNIELICPFLINSELFSDSTSYHKIELRSFFEQAQKF